MPVITKIAEQKRRKTRRSVYLDGQFAFGCHLNVVARFRLREGMRLDEAQVKEIGLGEVKQECFDHALKLLSTRLHSTAEIRRKLSRREYGEEVVDAVIADLMRLGYLDDAQFARAKAQMAAKYKKQGKRRAKVELIKAGVKGEVADGALNDVYDQTDTLAVARELARKQAPRLKKLDPQTARRRLAGMLQRRGFDYDEIKPVLDETIAWKSSDDDED
jgi:regulatory protein